MIEIKQETGYKNIYRLVAIDTESNTNIAFSELRGTDKPVPFFYCKVDEPYMGKHIGTNLLKETVKYAKEKGFEGIFVRFDGNVRAKMMLKKQGFKLYSKDIAMIEF